MPTFSTIDLLIVAFLIGSVGRGLRIGFFRQAFSIAGFFIGLFIGSWFIPNILKLFVDPIHFTLTSALAIFLFAVAFSELGDFLGHKLRLVTAKNKLQKAESYLGVALSAGSVLVAAWLIASLVGRLPIAGIDESLSRSVVLRNLNSTLPPAPNVIAGIGRYISPNGFPDVFSGDAPDPAEPLPPSSPEVQAAAAKGIDSTVKIQGFGCGGIMSGSGFVIGENLIATNAHVLAGMSRPIVYDKAGRHAATPIWFNASLDFAILRVSGLYGRPLPLATETLDRGTSAAVIGYPGGGNLEIDESVILATRQAVGRNIYGSGVSRRTIYELQTFIDQGNSGGPVVLPDGRVAGVIFAKSAEAEGYGYAIAASQLEREVSQATAQNRQVSTGPCAE